MFARSTPGGPAGQAGGELLAGKAGRCRPCVQCLACCCCSARCCQAARSRGAAGRRLRPAPPRPSPGIHRCCARSCQPRRRRPRAAPGQLRPQTHLSNPPPCSGEHTYAYARLPNLIQGQGQLAAKLVFQPASLQSNLHRQMRAATEKLHVKSQKARLREGSGAGATAGGLLRSGVHGGVGCVGAASGSLVPVLLAPTACGALRLYRPLPYTRVRATAHGGGPPVGCALPPSLALLTAHSTACPPLPRFPATRSRCAPPPRWWTPRRPRRSRSGPRRSASARARSWRRSRPARSRSLACPPTCARRARRRRCPRVRRGARCGLGPGRASQGAGAAAWAALHAGGCGPASCAARAAGGGPALLRPPRPAAHLPGP